MNRSKDLIKTALDGDKKCVESYLDEYAQTAEHAGVAHPCLRRRSECAAQLYDIPLQSLRSEREDRVPLREDRTLFVTLMLVTRDGLGRQDECRNRKAVVCS